MKQEDIHIIEGTPSEVKEHLVAFMDSHPNARIFSSALAFKPGEPIKPPANDPEAAASGGKAAKKTAKKTAANAQSTEGTGGEGTSTPPPDEETSADVATELTSFEYGPATPYLTVIVGKEWS